MRVRVRAAEVVGVEVEAERAGQGRAGRARGWRVESSCRGVLAFRWRFFGWVAYEFRCVYCFFLELLC